MSPLAYTFWILNIILDTAGHLAFKYAAISEHETEWGRWKKMLSSLPLWIGMTCFVLEFVVWLGLLSLVPLSLGMLVGSINIVVVMFAGKLLFHERLDKMRIAGMWLITFGVALAGGRMSTKRFYLLGFGALMLFDTLTQVSFKLATTHAGAFVPTMVWLREVFFNPWIYGAISGYIGSFVTWMTLLKHAPVGPSFAASHLEVVTVLAISVIYFGESLSALQVLGALLIVAGIVCLSKSEGAHSH